MRRANKRLTHADRLTRWLGREQVEHLASLQRGFLFPIPLLNVPGHVFVYDGDYYGEIVGGGFASLSDLISEATTGGKRQDFYFSKTATLSVLGANGSLWNVGTRPGAAGLPAARPGGAVPTNATTGAFGQSNAAGGDTLHITTAFAQGSAGPSTLLLYDRIFHAGTINHNTASAQTITGVPTRYATTTSPGNFAFLEVTTVLPNTAHTITMQYTDQDGNTAENAPAIAGVNSAAVTRIDHTPYHIPLNAGDTGLRTCTQITISAGASGVSNFVMGHPLAFIPCPVANNMVVLDGINSAFNLVQILDGACLALLELKGVATATTYNGSLIMVSG